MDIDTATKLMNLRKSHGLSQEELAEQVGVSRQAVSKWERAESSPDTDNLIVLSKIYGVSIDEMLNINAGVNFTGESENTPGNSGDYFEPTEKMLAMISAMSIFLVIIYMVLGFGFSLWHPGWIIFLAIPIFWILDVLSNTTEKKERDRSGWKVFPFPLLVFGGFIALNVLTGSPLSWLVFLLIPVWGFIIRK